MLSVSTVGLRSPSLHMYVSRNYYRSHEDDENLCLFYNSSEEISLNTFNDLMNLSIHQTQILDLHICYEPTRLSFNWHLALSHVRPPREQSSWGQHGAHLAPVGPRWAQCWAHEPCYQGRVSADTALTVKLYTIAVKD